MKVLRDNLKFSKILRKNQTPWEYKLWMYLRANRFQNLKFKRQVPIGKYVVDLSCDKKKLVIELDGGQHGEPEISKLDKEKETYLKKEGYFVLRFWYNEIDGNLEGVLNKINNVATSLPTSPHAWGEGNSLWQTTYLN